MNKTVIVAGRSWRRDWSFGLVVVVSIAGGVAAGFRAARPQPRSLLFRPVDPDTSCGPVSLALVGHWLGAPGRLDEWNRLTHASETGVSSLLDLQEAARAQGLAAAVVRLDPTRPLPWDLPTILHMHENHFVATLPTTGDSLVLADPPIPPRILDRRRLVGDWNGVALVVSRSRDDLDRALARAGFLK